MHITKTHCRFYLYLIYAGVFKDICSADGGLTLNVPKDDDVDLEKPLYVGKTFDIDQRLMDHNKPGHLLYMLRIQHKDITVRFYECNCEGEMSTLEQALIFRCLPVCNNETTRNTKKFEKFLTPETSQVLLCSRQKAYYHNSNPVKLKELDAHGALVQLDLFGSEVK